MDRRASLRFLVRGALAVAVSSPVDLFVSAATRDSRIDINHASMEELLTLPGMTRTWATRIVRFRPYRMKSDLVDRGVVSDQIYGRIKELIVAHRDAR